MTLNILSYWSEMSGQLYLDVFSVFLSLFSMKAPFCLVGSFLQKMEKKVDIKTLFLLYFPY